MRAGKRQIYDVFFKDILTTSQIDQNLRHHPATCNYFEGVFALNQLPTYYLTNRPSLVVCNTAYSESPGEHWVCFFLGQNQVEYFDSYGCPPSNQALNNFIALNGGDNTCFNTRCLQSVNAATCGKYVTTYLLYRSMGFTTAQYLNEFNVAMNSDRTVRKLYESLFGTEPSCKRGQICRSFSI
jgi:hypothetical protein